MSTLNNYAFVNFCLVYHRLPYWLMPWINLRFVQTMLNTLATFCIIFQITALSFAGKIIYVSRFSGNDSTTCGTPLLPCSTISYAIHQASEGSYIHIDGTFTSKDPYLCQTLKTEYSVGVYLTKSISFVGILCLVSPWQRVVGRRPC